MMLDRLDIGLSVLERVLYFGAAAAMAMMMVSISLDTVGRTFLGTPIKGVYEFNEMYLLTATVYLSIARAQRNSEHIAVNTLYDIMAPWVQLVVRICWRLLTIGVFGAIVFKTGDMAIDQFLRGNRTSGVVELPSWVGWFLVALGSATMVLRLVLQVVFDLSGRNSQSGSTHVRE